MPAFSNVARLVIDVVAQFPCLDVAQFPSLGLILDYKL